MLDQVFLDTTQIIYVSTNAVPATLPPNHIPELCLRDLVRLDLAPEVRSLLESKRHFNQLLF